MRPVCAVCLLLDPHLHLHCSAPPPGIRHIHAMPIRSSPSVLLAVLNLGFKHEPCLDMGFMGPHLFSTYISLMSATLTAVVRDPGLNAYVCLARDLAEATSLDSIMQVRTAAGHHTALPAASALVPAAAVQPFQLLWGSQGNRS